MIKVIFLISIGGALGSTFRYLINISLNNFTILNYHIGTLVVNLIGSFLIGLFASILKNYYVINEDIIKYFFMIGFIGSFTTFSGFSLETINMLNSGNYSVASIYITISIILNLFAVYIGLNILNYIN